MSSREIMAAGLRTAQSLGHQVRGMQPDLDNGYIRECSVCGLWVAANAQRGAGGVGWGHPAQVQRKEDGMTIYMVSAEDMTSRVEVMVSLKGEAKRLVSKLRFRYGQDVWVTPVEIYRSAEAAREAISWPVDR